MASRELTVMMSSSSEALVEELAKARDEVRQAKSDLAESANRVAVLELQCAQLPTVEVSTLFRDLSPPFFLLFSLMD